MKLNTHRVVNNYYPNVGNVVAITHGKKNIDEADCMINLKMHPSDDAETQIFKTIIQYQAEEIFYLKKVLGQQGNGKKQIIT